MQAPLPTNEAERLELAVRERQQAEQRLAAEYATARVLAEAATLKEATPRILEAICTIIETPTTAIRGSESPSHVERENAMRPIPKSPDMIAISRPSPSTLRRDAR